MFQAVFDFVGAIAAAALQAASPSAPQVYPGGALDTNCSHVADGLDGPGYQFIAVCPGHSVSPDGRWAVEQPGDGSGSVFLTDSRAVTRDDLTGLMDAMPFVLVWSPRSDRFFANHYQGSTMERLRIFWIVNSQAVENSAVFANAVVEMIHRYPCLTGSAVYASGWQWSRDGARIAMTVYAHPASCARTVGAGATEQVGNWEVLWMIGDIESGRIVPASVRIRRNGVGPMPADGPYASL